MSTMTHKSWLWLGCAGLGCAGLVSLVGCAAPPTAAIAPSTVPSVLAIPADESIQPAASTAPAAASHSATASAGELVGKKCRLQFRRDALGLNAPGVLEPTAISSGGKAVSLVGVVDQISDGWVVMRVNKQMYWVPTAQILLLQLAE